MVKLVNEPLHIPSDQLAAHRDRFYSQPRPFWLKDCSLADDLWIVELHNPKIRRNASTTIRLDAPIGPSLSLNDPSLSRDLLTAKKYIFNVLSGPSACIHATSSLKEEYLTLLNFTRWRHQRGLPSNADLTRPWFEEFCESLRDAGLEGLLRSEERVSDLVNEWRGLGRSPPLEKQGCFAIYTCARLAGFESPRQLSDNATRILVEWARSEGVTIRRELRRRVDRQSSMITYRSSSLERYIRVWYRLGSLKAELDHDPPGYCPFTNRRETSRLAAGMGTPLSRTPTPPAQQACFLIDRALRWVLLYAEDLQRLLEVTARDHDLERRIKNPAQWTRAVHDLWRSDMPRFLNQQDALGAPDVGLNSRIKGVRVPHRLQHIYMRLLPAACAIVIAAFSARRVEEIRSLCDDCIENDSGDLWLKTSVAKSPNGRDRIPASFAVTRAVEVLQWLSASAREATGEPWLFLLHDPHNPGGRPVSPDIRRSLTAFAKAMDVPPLADGSQWSFSPHQFRRFFAVLYYYRYRDRSLTALSQFLLHYDPDSTRTYITEARRGGFLKLVDEANVDLAGIGRPAELILPLSNSRRGPRSTAAKAGETAGVRLKPKFSTYQSADFTGSSTM